ncbi:hypothetical protein CHL78_012315 [Romboutsia weinsteinii]|uniref:Uncharacterized protein n=1 Tax=Romboutsia weinsteinii TaxID=2020949 RepID=A0A371J1S4_9FIRM|nr:hypothetical protein [Romboutsia weinsteinii]RDY26730.1 hypothetical protein CHL78_012315 [Romboutsia weinsteinii]
MNMIFSIVKRMIASNKVSFIITAIVVLCATTSKDSAIALSNGNYTWLLAVMTPFSFVFYAYPKLMHLGASKKDYYIASILSYGLLALFISIVNTAIHLLIDPINNTQTVINLMELCGWTQNGMLVAFLQQVLFLMLGMIFLHVLLSMQTHWYGWLTGGVLIAIICIFTPIEPLRHILVGFFKIIMFNSNALLHMGVCVLLIGVLSMIDLVILKRKTL